MSAPTDSPMPAAHWAAVAAAARDARRFREDGLPGCYGDTSLWNSAELHVRGQLERAILAAIAAAPDCREDLVDALRAGDPALDGDALLDDIQAGKEALATLLREWPWS
jgi:hypothetical protein